MTWFGRLLTGAALNLLPSAALACECDDISTLSAAELEKRAQTYARLNLVLAEVERVDDARKYDLPQRYRVSRSLFGLVPSREIMIYPRYTRLPDGSLVPASPGSSCSYYGTPNFRKVMAFTADPEAAQRQTCGVFARINDSNLVPFGMCLQYHLNEPAFVRRLVELKKAQAGVKRNSRPASSSR